MVVWLLSVLRRDQINNYVFVICKQVGGSISNKNNNTILGKKGEPVNIGKLIVSVSIQSTGRLQHSRRHQGGRLTDGRLRLLSPSTERVSLASHRHLGSHSALNYRPIMATWHDNLYCVTLWTMADIPRLSTGSGTTRRWADSFRHVTEPIRPRFTKGRITLEHINGEQMGRVNSDILYTTCYCLFMYLHDETICHSLCISGTPLFRNRVSRLV